MLLLSPAGNWHRIRIIGISVALCLAPGIAGSFGQALVPEGPCVVDADCDDGVFCNGVEICDPLLDCQPGTRPDCDDGLDCTDDVCDPVLDVCTSVPQSCDDGDPCTADQCDPGTDACENVPPDDVDGDGICDAADSCPTQPNPEKGLHLEVNGGAVVVLSWNRLSALYYDVILADLAQVSTRGSLHHLGTVTCVENNSTDTQAGPLFGTPALGEVFLYLVRYFDGNTVSSYGLGGDCIHERVVDAGDCPN